MFGLSFARGRGRQGGAEGKAHASGAATLPSLTASGSVTKATTATGAASVAPLVASGTAGYSQAHEATGAATAPLTAATGTAEREIGGTGASSVPALTAEGNVFRLFSASGSATIAKLAATGAAEEVSSGEFVATGSPTLKALTAAGTGERIIPGEGSVPLAAVTASGSAGVKRDAAGSASIAALLASGTAERVITGSGSASLGVLTATGQGLKEIGATGSPSLSVLSASGSAFRGLSSSGSATLAAATASGEAAITQAEHMASGSATIAAVTAEGASAPVDLTVRVTATNTYGSDTKTSAAVTIPSTSVWEDVLSGYWGMAIVPGSSHTTLYVERVSPATVCQDNDPVGTIVDHISGITHTSASDASRPIYRTSGGLHWIETDGVDDTIFVSTPTDYTGNVIFAATGVRRLQSGNWQRFAGITLNNSPDHDSTTRIAALAGNTSNNMLTQRATAYGGSPALDLTDFIAAAGSAPTATFNQKNGASETTSTHADLGAFNVNRIQYLTEVTSTGWLYTRGRLYCAVVVGRDMQGETALRDRLRSEMASRSGVML